MGMIQEFKEFAVKGNAMDLAVGVIIGGAFGKIVDSMVGDLIMPIIGAVVGKIDFSSMFVVLGTVPEGTAMVLADLKKAGVPVLAKLAAILQPMCPDLPMPMTTTFPWQSNSI